MWKSGDNRRSQNQWEKNPCGKRQSEAGQIIWDRERRLCKEMQTKPGSGAQHKAVLLSKVCSLALGGKVWGETRLTPWVF